LSEEKEKAQLALQSIASGSFYDSADALFRR